MLASIQVQRRLLVAAHHVSALLSVCPHNVIGTWQLQASHGGPADREALLSALRTTSVALSPEGVAGTWCVPHSPRPSMRSLCLGVAPLQRCKAACHGRHCDFARMSWSVNWNFDTKLKL